MKKLINALFCAALCASIFSSCEDVPMPYDMPTKADNNNNNNNSSETKADPAGKGTAEDPYNVSAAIDIIKATDQNSNTPNMYVKGQIVEIKQVETEKFGNASYYISDGTDKTQRLYVFQSLYLGNKKFTSQNQIKVGDVVVIYGPFVNFRGNTPETVSKGATYIYSLNGQTADSNNTSTTENTAETAYSVAKAIELISTNKAPENEVFVKGIISKAPTFNAKYGSLTYYVSDNGKDENALQIFSGLSFNGQKFTSDKDLQVGQTVVVKGYIKAYTNKENVTINEMDKNNVLITVNGKTELIKADDNNNNSGNDNGNTTPQDNSLSFTAADLGLTNNTAIGTQTLKDGTTLSSDKGTNNAAPAYYSAGGGTIRFYPSNTITLNAGSKTIESITFVCDTYNKVNYTAEGKITATSGTVTLNGLTFSIAGIKSSKVTLTNVNTGKGGATQCRIKSITINYAK